MALFSKQKEVFKAVKSNKYRVFGLGGGANSGKTIIALAIFHLLAQTFPGTRWAVVRKSDRVLRRNTIPSFRKMLRFIGETNPPKIVWETARYPNGSEILFVWADITKDPDLHRVRGLEVAGILFDEGDEVDRGYFDISFTRIGRWNIDSYGNRAPAIVMVTCNPNKSWPKDVFYDRANENRLPSDWFFQLSLPSDNPTVTKETWNLYKNLPEEYYNRYVKGLWDYDDDPAQLITYQMYKNVRVYKDDLDLKTLKGPEIFSIDPMDEGKDRMVMAFMRGDTIYDYEEKRKYDEIKAANLAKERYRERNASNIIVDAIGVGAGTANTLKHDDFPVYKFIAGGKPVTSERFFKFKNRRAEAGWLLRRDIRDENIQILHIPEVQKQLLAIKYKTDDKTIVIEPKAVIKKRLGYSPDYYDAITYVNYLRSVVGGNLITSKIIAESKNEDDSDNEETMEGKYGISGLEDLESKYDL